MARKKPLEIIGIEVCPFCGHSPTIVKEERGGIVYVSLECSDQCIGNRCVYGEREEHIHQFLELWNRRAETGESK